MADRIIVIDIGNTKSKLAVCESGKLSSDIILSDHETTVSEALHLARSCGAIGCLISSVAAGTNKIVGGLRDGGLPTVLLSVDLALPFRIGYETPSMMGTDRIAGVAGVVASMGRCDALIIDAGTAITYDYLSADGELTGGAISPGIGMRFKALHAFTARLPLLPTPEGKITMIGTTTRDAIYSGVMNGVMAETNHFITKGREKRCNMVVVFTGGDHKYFDLSAKKAIFARPNLVLEGLAYIAYVNFERIAKVGKQTKTRL